MANIGDRLLQPEEGWKRIDDRNINIKYVGNDWVVATSSVVYNGTSHYCEKNQNSSYIEFYFYGTKLRIIDIIFSNRCEITNITIDDNIIEHYSTKNSNTDDSDRTKVYQLLVYEKLNLDKKIHKCKIYTNNTVGTLSLDCFDIDEDGYMLYYDETKDKLYYDITPTLISDNKPDPYVAIASSVYNDYNAYNAFDGISTSLWISGLDKITNQYLRLSFKEKTKTNAVLIKTDNASNCPKDFIIKGLNENDVWEEIYRGTFTKNNKNENFMQIFNFDISNYKTYELFFINNQGNTGDGGGRYIDISEIRYLLEVNTPFYLIKDNTDNKIYNYDEENNDIIEVEDISLLKEDIINNDCIYKLSKVAPLLDNLSDDLTILCNNNKKVIASGIKSNNELIIAKHSFSTRLAKNIDFFELVASISNTSSIKIAVSNDEGNTWKIYDNSIGEFVDLSKTCPLKEYQNLTIEELEQWSDFKDEVYSNGIESDELKNIDFNSIKSNSMMFAYVFNRESYIDVCEMNKLQYQFDAEGIYTALKDSEVDIKQNSESISIIPKKDIELMKINIGSSGNINIYNGSNENIEEATDEDINNILGGDW